MIGIRQIFNSVPDGARLFGVEGDSMKNIKAKKIIYTIMLIVKDSIRLLTQCLITTILVSVCLENGWLLSYYATDVSFDMFWNLYSAIFVLVPIILFYRGFTGRYYAERKECKAESTMVVEKNEENNYESN